MLKRFDESDRGVLREMPAVARAEAGYELRPRGAAKFAPRAAEALHERLGNRFYDVVSLTKSGLESHLGEDPDLPQWALDLAEKGDGAELDEMD